MLYFYQYDCMVGLLQLFHAHVLPYVDVTIEVTARMFGCLGECVDDVLVGKEDSIYPKKRIQKQYYVGL